MGLFVEILLVVDLFLWFLSLLPIPNPPGQFAWASGWLAWIAAVLLAVALFVGRAHI